MNENIPDTFLIPIGQTEKIDIMVTISEGSLFLWQNGVEGLIEYVQKKAI